MTATPAAATASQITAMKPPGNVMPPTTPIARVITSGIEVRMADQLIPAAGATHRLAGASNNLS